VAKSSKERLLEAGLGMLLERGYHDLGIQQVLDMTSVPKGSFYHYFKSKEDFALQIVDLYMVNVHRGLDETLSDPATLPLQRIRNFFEATLDGYRQQGYLGCLLGGLGQELSGVSQTFRDKIEACIADIARRLSGCLEEARLAGQIASDSDTVHMGELLVNCWEGAALRTRLLRDPTPGRAMLDFYFRAVGVER
jgi:TetR/AcrR family transcriptional regulator, transcriptional repressor for nem operon